MYGKHFASLYDGSMVGSGAIMFAVWGYVIANQVPDRVVGSQVRLNPVVIGAILGEPVEKIEEAITKLCAPDPKSTTKKENGCRLKKIGEFEYRVVNGAKYRGIRDAEERRAQNREAKRKQRSKPVAGESYYDKRYREGAPQEELDAIAAGERYTKTSGELTGEE